MQKSRMAFGSWTRLGWLSQWGFLLKRLVDGRDSRPESERDSDAPSGLAGCRGGIAYRLTPTVLHRTVSERRNRTWLVYDQAGTSMKAKDVV